jgi:hypothetical protein
VTGPFKDLLLSRRFQAHWSDQRETWVFNSARNNATEISFVQGERTMMPDCHPAVADGCAEEASAPRPRDFKEAMNNQIESLFVCWASPGPFPVRLLEPILRDH